MFHVGEFVVYGSQGVCKVTDVGCLNLPGAPDDRLYYTLEPCHILGGKVFTPVDNQKAIIRPVISKDEAITLIDDMTDIETLWVPDERKRESYYKDALRKVTTGDEKYLHLAESNLYGELAVALDMEQEQVKQFIIDRIKDTQEADAEIS